MTTYRVVVAERKELATVTIVCPNPKCGAQTSLDIETERPPSTSNPGKIPHYCACCELPYDDLILEALGGLATFHRAARKAETKCNATIFTFGIRQHEQ